MLTATLDDCHPYSLLTHAGNVPSSQLACACMSLHVPSSTPTAHVCVYFYTHGTWACILLHPRHTGVYTTTPTAHGCVYIYTHGTRVCIQLHTLHTRTRCCGSDSSLALPFSQQLWMIVTPLPGPAHGPKGPFLSTMPSMLSEQCSMTGGGCRDAPRSHKLHVRTFSS